MIIHYSQSDYNQRRDVFLRRIRLDPISLVSSRCFDFPITVDSIEKAALVDKFKSIEAAQRPQTSPSRRTSPIVLAFPLHGSDRSRLNSVMVSPASSQRPENKRPSNNHVPDCEQDHAQPLHVGPADALVTSAQTSSNPSIADQFIQFEELRLSDSPFSSRAQRESVEELDIIARFMNKLERIFIPSVKYPRWREISYCTPKRKPH